VSRIVVHDLDNHGVGEFTAMCNRGWMVYGNPGVSGAGMTSIIVPDEVISEKWLQLGRMVLVSHPKLPAWAGMIDTPWKAILPAELSLYNAEYLFSIRSPEQAKMFSGSIPSIVREMIRIMNEQEQMFLSVGAISGDTSVHDETLDQRTMWDQLVPMLERSGFEMILRPERGAGKQLHLYADVGQELGVDTGFLLHDSEQGKNMKVLEASVNGSITNRVIGVSGQSTAEDQLKTSVLEEQISQNIYRTRSKTVQFRNIVQLSTLTGYAQAFLDDAQQPYLDIDVEAYDVGDTFYHLRPGNRLLLRSSNLYLPGGRRGWSGTVRALAMVYDEQNNAVLMKARGLL
jgi:hypothetical protein